MNDIIESYLLKIPDDRKFLINQLHQLIVDMYPASKVSMKYKMPTYHAKDGWVAIANQKHYVSLYTCGYHHIAEFRERQPKIKTGKGCINFKPTDELPIEDIKSVVRHAIEYPKTI